MQVCDENVPLIDSLEKSLFLFYKLISLTDIFGFWNEMNIFEIQILKIPKILLILLNLFILIFKWTFNKDLDYF